MVVPIVTTRITHIKLKLCFYEFDQLANKESLINWVLAGNHSFITEQKGMEASIPCVVIQRMSTGKSQLFIIRDLTEMRKNQTKFRILYQLAGHTQIWKNPKCSNRMGKPDKYFPLPFLWIFSKKAAGKKVWKSHFACFHSNWILGPCWNQRTYILLCMPMVKTWGGGEGKGWKELGKTGGNGRCL